MLSVDEAARQWDQALAKRIGEAVKHRRNELGWPQQRLAEVTARLGYPLTGVVISQIETNARGGRVDVAEIVVLAAAMFVPPVQLLYPDLVDGTVDLLPGCTTSSIRAVEWFSGNVEPLATGGDTDEEDGFLMWEAGARPTMLSRRLDELRRTVSALPDGDAAEAVRDEIAALTTQARRSGLTVDATTRD